MSTATFRSSTYQTSFNSTSDAGVGAQLVLGKPAGVVAGDLLLAFSGGDVFGQFYGAIPEGWTAVVSAAPAGGQAYPVVLSRTATASEPSSYTFPIGYSTRSGGGYGSVLLVAYNSSGLGIDASAAAVGTTSAPSVTPVRPGDTLVTYFCCSGFATTSTPTGMSAQVTESTGGSDFCSVIDDQVISGTSATGTRTTSNTANLAVSLLLVANVPPNAPATNLPDNNSTVDLTQPQRFTWTFAGYGADTQSKFSLRYSSNGGTTWTTITRVTPSAYLDIPGGTLAAGSFQWQVRTYGSGGLVGPYSASAFFTAAVPPNGPTITDPTNGTPIPSSTQDFTFSYPDCTSWRYQVVDSDGTVIVPLTTVTGSAASGRTFTVTGLANGTTITTTVAVEDGGLWSADASSTNTVSYTPPPTPVLTVTADDTAAVLNLTYTTPAPTGGNPAATSAQILMSLDGGATSFVHYLGQNVPITGAWTYYTPASGQAYAFQIRVTADNGVTASSLWIS